MKRVMEILKDVSSEQRGRVKEAVQTALQDGSLQVEFVVKEKNQRILALELDRHKLQERVHALERLKSSAMETAAIKAKDEEIAALQRGAKTVVANLTREKEALENEVRRMSLSPERRQSAPPGLPGPPESPTPVLPPSSRHACVGARRSLGWSRWLACWRSTRSYEEAAGGEDHSERVRWHAVCRVAQNSSACAFGLCAGSCGAV